MIVAIIMIGIIGKNENIITAGIIQTVTHTKKMVIILSMGGKYCMTSSIIDVAIVIIMANTMDTIRETKDPSMANFLIRIMVDMGIIRNIAIDTKG